MLETAPGVLPLARREVSPFVSCIIEKNPFLTCSDPARVIAPCNQLAYCTIGYREMIRKNPFKSRINGYGAPVADRAKRGMS
jgi:hypothetical protein